MNCLCFFCLDVYFNVFFFNHFIYKTITLYTTYSINYTYIVLATYTTDTYTYTNYAYTTLRYMYYNTNNVYFNVDELFDVFNVSLVLYALR